MREYIKAIEAIQHAGEIDDGSNTKEIQQQLIKCNQALSAQRAGESEEETLQRAMRDPEVAVRFHCYRSFFHLMLSLTLQLYPTENHGRPRYATDSTAGAAGPWCASGAYEKSDGSREHYETRECGYYQDAVKMRDTLACCTFGGYDVNDFPYCMHISD